MFTTRTTYQALLNLWGMAKKKTGNPVFNYV